MPHILLYTSPAIGGLLHYNHALLCALQPLGYELTYVQDFPDALVDMFGPVGTERVRQRANWFVEQQRALGITQHIWLENATAAEAERVVATTKPDLVICSNGGPVANFFVKRAAIQLQIPFLIIEHLVHPVKPKEDPRAYAELAQQYVAAQAVVAVSQNNLHLLRKFFGLAEDKGQVIYCGRPAEYFQPPDPKIRSRLRQAWQIPAEAVLCFTAARLDIIKGYQYQLAAMKRLKSTPVWDHLYFAWAGKGTLEEHYQQAVHQAGVSDRVKFLGELDHITDWLDASDLFILTSESEGLPLAMMEAMAKGLPVIATAVSGIPEGLGDTGKLLTTPILEPRTTIEELTETLTAWVPDATLRQQIGTACRQRAEQMFRAERMLAETIALVQAALPKSRQG